MYNKQIVSLQQLFRADSRHLPIQKQAPFFPSASSPLRSPRNTPSHISR